jgi:hypothetical protein
MRKGEDKMKKMREWLNDNGFSNWIVSKNGSAYGMPLKKGTLLVEYKDRSGENCVCTIRDADDFGAFKNGFENGEIKK